MQSMRHQLSASSRAGLAWSLQNADALFEIGLYRKRKWLTSSTNRLIVSSMDDLCGLIRFGRRRN